MLLDTLLVALVVFAILGFACWLVITYVPMPAPLKNALVVVVVLLFLLYVVRWLLITQPALRGV